MSAIASVSSAPATSSAAACSPPPAAPQARAPADPVVSKPAEDHAQPTASRELQFPQAPVPPPAPASAPAQPQPQAPSGAYALLKSLYMPPDLEEELERIEEDARERERYKARMANGTGKRLLRKLDHISAQDVHLLKEICRRYGLKCGGRKPELVNRLMYPNRGKNSPNGRKLPKGKFKPPASYAVPESYHVAEPVASAGNDAIAQTGKNGMMADYMKLSVADLRQECAWSGLKNSGTKAELVYRLCNPLAAGSRPDRRGWMSRRPVWF